MDGWRSSRGKKDVSYEGKKESLGSGGQGEASECAVQTIRP